MMKGMVTGMVTVVLVLSICEAARGKRRETRAIGVNSAQGQGRARLVLRGGGMAAALRLLSSIIG